MSKKKSLVADKRLMLRCSKAWLGGNSVVDIAEMLPGDLIDYEKDMKRMSGLIRAWRKQHPELFPLRHKKHAPRRKSTSYDITLRFDAYLFGRHFLKNKTFDELTKKQQIAMIQKNLDLSGPFDPLHKLFTQILSIK